MSSTRKAKDDSVFHQDRYASSPEFERGLRANLVAKRLALIDDAADRELLWFIQYLSHQAGGLAAVVKQIIADFPERIQTQEMSAANLKPGTMCNAEQVRKLRVGFGSDSEDFILKGEAYNCLYGGCGPMAQTFIEEVYRLGGESSWLEDKERADKHPTGYLSDVFFLACCGAAERNLEKELAELCLNPESSFASRPWYFPRLIETLREFKADFSKGKSAVAVVTVLGEIVNEALDYTAYGHGLTLLQGEARTGKSHAARTWCEAHPGRARFIEVPPSNDECSFFRALARGLGLGNFLNYKAAEIRARVESVLRTGDILLVLDEAQRLWPQKNYRYGFPNRVLWVMTMANDGVPIAMISTPQFFQIQKAVEKTGWNSAQFTGRISHYKQLPSNLSQEDLFAVAKAALPSVGSLDHKAVAMYAMKSERNLAAIEAISKRACYLAMKAGRDAATGTDVQNAMRESVLPSDWKLNLALASGKKPKAAGPSDSDPIAVVPILADESEPLQPISQPDEAESPLPSRLAHTRGSQPLPLHSRPGSAPTRSGLEAVLTAD